MLEEGKPPAKSWRLYVAGLEEQPLQFCPVVANVISKEAKDTTLAASCVQDSKTGDVILKMVNAGNEPKTMKINLSYFKNLVPDAEKTVLTGNADAENTFENPKNVVPLLSTFKVSSKFEYSAPAMSLTVIRIKKKS
jgi:alpha-L-arabinofuranosidase